MFRLVPLLLPLVCVLGVTAMMAGPVVAGWVARRAAKAKARTKTAPEPAVVSPEGGR